MLIYLLSVIDNEEDRVLFIEIYSEYKQTLFKIARMYLADDSLIEDCVQDTFLDLIKYLEAFKKIEIENRRKYISSVCKYAAFRINNASKNDLECEIYDEDKTISQNENDFTFSDYDRFEVIEAVNKLDEIYRAPLVLRYFEGLSVNAISERLGITPNLASQRLRRARKKLHDLLKDDENDGGIIP